MVTTARVGLETVFAIMFSITHPILGKPRFNTPRMALLSFASILLIMEVKDRSRRDTDNAMCRVRKKLVLTLIK